MIKTISYDQHEILRNIQDLYVPSNRFDCDPTYSKGNFYKGSGVHEPVRMSDLYPQNDQIIKENANNIDLPDSSIMSICFDPPFVVGHTKSKPTGIIGERFHGFKYIKDLWKWYSECIAEHYRVLGLNGIYVFKCQDTVSSGKQWMSHVFIINQAEKIGFYVKDMFILLAKNRIIGHNHHTQKHARKFHSYFIVFEKNEKKRDCCGANCQTILG